MAKVYRQIGSLSELINNLKLNGIYSIKSLSDIQLFKKNFNEAINKIREEKKTELLKDIENLRNKFEQLSNEYESNTKLKTEDLLREKSAIESWLSEYDEKSKTRSLLFKIMRFHRHTYSVSRLDILTNSFDSELRKLLLKPFQNLSKIKAEINDKTTYIEKWVDVKSKFDIEKIQKVNSVIEENKKLYYGAEGEQQALDELQKLPDSYVVINDYKRNFAPPVYDKRSNDHIRSVQIDHIVIGPTGLFIIETKNWSQESVDSLDLFSPVKQLLRSNFAIFVLLNGEAESGSLRMFNQYWGVRQISPKNIILMVRHKPNQEFQHVKILSLPEVRQYITYGKEVFSVDQVKDLSDYLVR